MLSACCAHISIGRLRAVAIRDDRFKTSTIDGIHFDGDPNALPADSHDCERSFGLFRQI